MLRIQQVSIWAINKYGNYCNNSFRIIKAEAIYVKSELNFSKPTIHL